MTAHTSISTSRIHQIISLIDLTNLNDDCDEATIDALCAQSSTTAGPVAAICIWPEFVSHARQLLGAQSSVQLATVVNFPSGDEKLPVICSTIETAIDAGATEIDYVLPYAALLAGDTDQVKISLQTVRRATPDNILLKVILETGQLNEADFIRQASSIAIDQGADFIKTSTGKVPVNATVKAASIMLETIKHTQRDVGFKAAGGISSIEDADTYLQLAEDKLGKEWPNPARFRFGASSLLNDALANLSVNLSGDGLSGDVNSGLADKQPPPTENNSY